MQKPKGTMDYTGNKLQGIKQIEDAIASLTHYYNIQEIRTPIFEHSDVYHRSVGELSDIVSKETYTFTDRGERSLTLRPEGTAGVVRSVVENKLYTEPQKFYYVGPFFRYERPQAGRSRQFHQFGVEYIGFDDPVSDAEIIIFAMTLLELLGLQETTLKINYLGNEATKQRYIEALVAYFTPIAHQLSDQNHQRLLQNPLRILDDKSLSMLDVPNIEDYLSVEEKNYFSSICQYLERLGIRYEIDPRIVRGLDYYTGMVFEVQSTHPDFGSQTAILGGGRYDNLIAEFGGPSTPATGFGLGIERLLLAMEYEQVLDDTVPGVDVAVCYMPSTKESAYELVQSIRVSGFRTEFSYQDKSLTAQLKQASKKDPQAIIIVAEEEFAQGKVLVKVDGHQDTVELAHIIDYLDGVVEEDHEHVHETHTV
jgi:histidyl-tRNA synthetase